MPLPATPRTIAINQLTGALSVEACDRNYRQSSPPFSGRRDEGFSPPGATPHSAREPEPEGSSSPPGLTSRSAPTPPNDKSPTREKRHQEHGCGGGGLYLSGPPDMSPPTDTNTTCYPYSGDECQKEKIGGDIVDARPDSCCATIPSAMCIVEHGVAASCVSPRSNAHGCARQLAVATQYLNRSLFIPAPPQQPNGNSNESGRARPATAGTAPEFVQAGRGHTARHRCNRTDSRPRTTSAGPWERSRLNPPLEGRIIWRSSLPGDDGQDRDLAASGLSSRALTGARAASSGVGSPSGGHGTSMARSPRKPTFVASPAKVGGGGTRKKTHREPVISRKEPETVMQRGHPPRRLCGTTPRQTVCSPPPTVGEGEFEAGVELIGEVGYTISSTAVARSAEGHEDGCGGITSGCNPLDLARPDIPELFVPSPSSSAVGKKTNSTAAVAVPRLQLDRLP